MFAGRFFAPRFFAPGYWAKVGAAAAPGDGTYWAPRYFAFTHFAPRYFPGIKGTMTTPVVPPVVVATNPVGIGGVTRPASFDLYRPVGVKRELTATVALRVSGHGQLRRARQAIPTATLVMPALPRPAPPAALSARMVLHVSGTALPENFSGDDPEELRMLGLI